LESARIAWFDGLSFGVVDRDGTKLPQPWQNFLRIADHDDLQVIRVQVLLRDALDLGGGDGQDL
jgi:hypothetical protein